MNEEHVPSSSFDDAILDQASSVLSEFFLLTGSASAAVVEELPESSTKGTKSDSEYEDTKSNTPEADDHEFSEPEYVPPGQRTRKRRAPTTSKIAQMMSQDLVSKRATPPRRGRGRPRVSNQGSRGGKSKSKAVSRAEYLAELANSRAQQMYLSAVTKCLPSITNPPPLVHQRCFVCKVDDLPALKRCSGGFKLFTQFMSDESTVKLYQAVSERFEFPPDSDDVMQIAQVLRHTWNTLPINARKSWELAARKRRYPPKPSVAPYDPKKMQKETDIAADALSRLMDNNMDYNAPIKTELETLVDEQSLPSMPLTEFPYHGSDRLKAPPPVKTVTTNMTVVKPDCCATVGEWTNFSQVQQHLIGNHFCAQLYACQFCAVMFQTKAELFAHTSCPLFTEFLEQKSTNKRKMNMKVCYMYMSCVDCGLWLPLKTDYTGEKFTRAWAFFSTIVKYHSCKTICPVLVFMAEPIVGSGNMKALRLRMNFIPSSLTEGLAVDCEDCGVQFASVEEMETHFKTKHIEKCYTCAKCKFVSGTLGAHRMHVLGHVGGEPIFFAYFLRSDYRFFPPPQSHEPSRVGYMAENVVAVGGVPDQTNYHLSTPVDYINHCDLMKTEKMANALQIARERFENAETEEEEDSGCSDVDENEDDFRPDMGLEFENYAAFGDSPEEAKLKSKLDKLFENQTPGSQKLADIKLEDCATIKRDLKIDDNVDLESLQAQNILFNSSSLADDLGKFLTRTVSLPMSACVELLSGQMLNREYFFCTSCSNILHSTATATHKCDKNKLLVLYCPYLPHNSRLQCHLCSGGACSLVGLRAHYAVQHLMPVEILKGPETFSDKPCTLMTLSTWREGEDNDKCWVAQYTDIALKMDANGGLLKKLATPPPVPAVYPVAQSAPKPAPPTTHVPIKPRPSTSVVASPASLTMSDNTMAIRAATVREVLQQRLNVSGNTSRIYPFYTSGSTVTCRFCNVQTVGQTSMGDHLRQMHALLCNGCGGAFASPRKLELHRSGCHFNRDRPVNDLEGTCGICQERTSLPQLYNHIFALHVRLLSYECHTGLLCPSAELVDVASHLMSSSNALSSGNDAFRKALEKKNKYESYEVYTPPGQVNYSCYLCGYETEMRTLLDIHIKNHPEHWSECPFCVAGVPIHSHQEMEEHLRSVHFTPKQDDPNSSVCGFCMQVLPSHLVCHVLYDCTQTRCCALCKNYRTTNMAELRYHWKTNHSAELCRFGCSICPLFFPHLDAFRNHTCSVMEMEQICSCGSKSHLDANLDEVFRNRLGFNRHFQMHMDLRNLRCLLCDKQFLTRYNLMAHRSAHCILLKDPAKREIRVNDSNTIVKELSTEELRCLMDEKMAAFKAMEEREKEEVAETLQDLLRMVCRDEGSPSVSPPLLEITNDTALLQAAVRTETGDDSMGGAGQPGYVADDDDDDDITFIQPEATDNSMCVATSVASSVVREVVDDDGDDELQVVAEVDHVAGAPSVSSISRPKSLKCPRCSSMFVTKKTLGEHLATAHKCDAGGVIDKVLGVPSYGSFWLCRCCCVAFEDTTDFKRHMQAHGSTAALSCRDCSSIAYNMTMFNQHAHAHVTDGKLLYGCGQCKTMFRTDAILCHHLRDVHKTALLFFCKNCSVTSSTILRIHTHLQTNMTCQKILRTRGFVTASNHNAGIGVCPANVVHFQPRNVAQFEAQISKGTLTTVTPSDCVHRSFLTPIDSVITCKDCNCLMTMASFSAHESYLNGGNTVDMTLSLDNSTEFPFGYELNGRLPVTNYSYPITSQPSWISSSSTSFSRRVGERQDQRTAASHPVGSIAPSPRVRPQEYAAVLPRQAVRVQPQVTPSGEVVRTAATLKNPLSASHKMVPQKRVAPSRTAPASDDDDIIMLEDGASSSNSTISMSGPAAKKSVSRVSSQAQLVAAATQSNACKICKVVLNSPQVRKLHELHLSGKMWFCLDCANAHKNEADAVRHYYSTHVTMAKMQKPGEDFHRLVYDLKCPFTECLNLPHFNMLSKLRNHFTTHHLHQMSHSSSFCSAKFCTAAAKKKHDKEHQLFEERNGIEGQCCPLCGLANQWNMQSETGHNMSHMAIHGLRKYSMCRDCFTCFSKDINNERIRAHFEQAHCTRNGSWIQCKICNVTLTQDSLRDHVISKHLVRGYKSRNGESGRLRVQVGAGTRNYLGMDPMAGDESDE